MKRFYPSDTVKMRAIPHLIERLFLISWENNRNCHITMPLSLKTMEVQIKGHQNNKRLRTVQVYCKMHAAYSSKRCALRSRKRQMHRDIKSRYYISSHEKLNYFHAILIFYKTDNKFNRNTRELN